MVRSLRTWLLIGSFMLFQVILLGALPKSAEAAATSSPSELSGINQQINYQGKLMGSSGAIVADGTYDMKFSLYEVASGGTAPFWTASGTTGVPTSIPVTVSNGLFTVMLGDTSAAGQWQNPLSSSSTYSWNTDGLYLGITIEADSEMTPRKRIASVPQAFNSMRLQGMSASGTGGIQDALFKIHRTDTPFDNSLQSALDVQTDATFGTGSYIMRLLKADGTATLSVNYLGDIAAQRLAVTGVSTRDGAAVSGVTLSNATDAWGGHFNSLLVGDVVAGDTIGAFQFGAVIKYASSSKNGLCLDDTETVPTCTQVSGASIVADGTINASAFDLAEQYTVTGEVEPGDLVAIDPENPLFVRRSSGGAYDPLVIGIVSTRPGFLLGDNGGSPIALSGRVPTKVSAMNGTIETGDVLTASPIPGVAMKATAPGRIIGYALQSASATSTIEVFVKVGYDAGSFLQADGQAALATSNLVMNAQTPATADATLADSWGVTLRGSVWDGLQAVTKDFTLFNKSLDASRSALSLAMGTSTLWSVDDQGSMQVTKDLFLGGRFFPATRSGAQTDKYVFLDDTGPASSTYIATNADGWQANTSYDFAERYYSPDPLEPGDVVMLSQQGAFHVQPTLKAEDVPVGIVSTRPAFVAGAPAPNTYPVALAGRVPTRVSALAGAIAVGDPLTPSTLPGVVVKATKAGPIVGYALETYSEQVIGKIEVFVNAGWWGGAVKTEEAQTSITNTSLVTTVAGPKSYQGVARILAGATQVRVVHPSLGTFPLIQVTPYGKVDAQWWTDNSSETGFEIVLQTALAHDVTFSWRAEEMRPTDGKLFLSNQEPAEWDIYTGKPILRTVPAPSNTQTLPDVTSTPEAPEVTPTTPAEEGTVEEEEEATPIEETPTEPADATPATSDEASDEVTPVADAVTPATEAAAPVVEAVTPEPVVVAPVVEVTPEPAPAPAPVEAAPAPAEAPAAPAPAES